MFERKIGNDIFELSHKLIPNPDKSTYINHIHSYCELLLFISGDVIFNIDGHLFEPKPYDLFLIPKATYHYMIPNCEVAYENYVIDLSPELMTNAQYDRIFSPPYKLNIRSNSELCEFFSRLDKYSEIYSESDFDSVSLMVVQELLKYCEYIRKAEKNHDSKKRGIVENIIEYISENLEEALNASSIASRFYISKSHLQNLFSQEMHISLKQYILQKKIFAANDDLKKGLSPGDVCKKYNFGDYTSFYRSYRKYFTIAPKNVFSGQK